MTYYANFNTLDGRTLDAELLDGNKASITAKIKEMLKKAGTAGICYVGHWTSCGNGRRKWHGDYLGELKNGKIFSIKINNN